MRHLPLLAACALATLSMLLISAKCIENDSLRRSSNGDWMIAGEIHNETDIQGTGMVLQGTLLDAAGNEIATAVTGGPRSLCPAELSPENLSAFYIIFPGSANLPEPAGYRVNVIAGKALSEPLPKLALTTNGEATRELDFSVTLELTYRLQQAYPDRRLAMCISFYDSSGHVIDGFDSTASFDLTQVGTDVTIVRPNLNRAPGGATHLRYWLWLTEPFAVESDHQAIASELIPLRSPIVITPR